MTAVSGGGALLERGEVINVVNMVIWSVFPVNR